MEYYGENNVRQFIFQLENHSQWKIGFESVDHSSRFHYRQSTVSRIGDKIVFQSCVHRLVCKNGECAYTTTPKPIETDENPNVVLLIINDRNELSLFNYWTGTLIFTEVTPKRNQLLVQGFKPIMAPRPMFHIDELYKARLNWMMFPQDMVNTFDYTLNLGIHNKTCELAVPSSYYFEFESLNQKFKFKMGRLNLCFSTNNNNVNLLTIERPYEDSQSIKIYGNRWGFFYDHGILTIYQASVFREVVRLSAHHSTLIIQGDSPMILVHPTFQYPSPLQYKSDASCIYQDCCRTLRAQCSVYGHNSMSHLYVGCFSEVRVNDGCVMAQTSRDKPLMYKDHKGDVFIDGHQLDPVIYNSVKIMGFYRDINSLWLFDVDRNVLLGRHFYEEGDDHDHLIVIPHALEPIVGRKFDSFENKKNQLFTKYGVSQTVTPRFINNDGKNDHYIRVDPRDKGQMLDVNVEYRSTLVFGLVHIEPFTGIVDLNVRGCRDIYIGIFNNKTGITTGRRVDSSQFYNNWEQEKNISIICRRNYIQVVDEHGSVLHAMAGSRVSVGYIGKPRNMIGIYPGDVSCASCWV